MTVVQNYQIRLLEELIFRHDKQAFVIIENTLNVLGKGFSCVKNINEKCACRSRIRF